LQIFFNFFSCFYFILLTDLTLDRSAAADALDITSDFSSLPSSLQSNSSGDALPGQSPPSSSSSSSSSSPSSSSSDSPADELEQWEVDDDVQAPIADQQDHPSGIMVVSRTPLELELEQLSNELTREGVIRNRYFIHIEEIKPDPNPREE